MPPKSSVKKTAKTTKKSIKKENENKIKERRKDKTFESLKKYYISLFFQIPKSKSHEKWFKDHGITYRNLKNILNTGITGANQKKVDKYKKTILNGKALNKKVLK